MPAQVQTIRYPATQMRAVSDLRLVDIEFDAKTLRVVAEINGTVQVAVTKLGE